MVRADARIPSVKAVKDRVIDQWPLLRGGTLREARDTQKQAIATTTFNNSYSTVPVNPTKHSQKKGLHIKGSDRCISKEVTVNLISPEDTSSEDYWGRNWGLWPEKRPRHQYRGYSGNANSCGTRKKKGGNMSTIKLLYIITRSRMGCEQK